MNKVKIIGKMKPISDGFVAIDKTRVYLEVDRCWDVKSNPNMSEPLLNPKIGQSVLTEDTEINYSINFICDIAKILENRKKERISLKIVGKLLKNK